MQVFRAKCIPGVISLPVRLGSPAGIEQLEERNKLVRDVELRYEGLLERERAEARHRFEALRERDEAERTELRQQLKTERERADRFAVQEAETRRSAEADKKAKGLELAVQKYAANTEIISLLSQIDELKQDLAEEQRNRIEAQASLSKAKLQIADLEDNLELDDALIHDHQESLRDREEELREVRQRSALLANRCAEIESELEEARVASRKGQAQAAQLVRAARHRTLEDLIPAFDLVRFAAAHDQLEEAHGLMHEAVDRFEESCVRVGRQPDQVISATDCARLLRTSKRALQQVPRTELYYEVVGTGAVRQHRLYRMRDCLTYLARSKN